VRSPFPTPSREETWQKQALAVPLHPFSFGAAGDARLSLFNAGDLLDPCQMGTYFFPLPGTQHVIGEKALPLFPLRFQTLWYGCGRKWDRTISLCFFFSHQPLA